MLLKLLWLSIRYHLNYYCWWTFFSFLCLFTEFYNFLWVINIFTLWKYITSLYISWKKIFVFLNSNIKNVTGAIFRSAKFWNMVINLKMWVQSKMFSRNVRKSFQKYELTFRYKMVKATKLGRIFSWKFGNLLYRSK